ncbi:MAG: dienelactone hydrolase family protein [bacterium]|nr:dienelactone hydrolase family protein [bacterium]
MRYGGRLLRALAFAFAACGPVAVVAMQGGASAPPLQAIDAAQRRLLESSAAIERLAGDHVMLLLRARLYRDAGDFRPGTHPLGEPRAAYAGFERNLIDLEQRSIEQLRSGHLSRMAEMRGAGEVWLRSSADGSLQPVGVYVPRSYAARTPAALVVFLHGLRQGDDEVVGSPIVQRLSERSGAIVIAPYARGDAGFEGLAARDVADGLAAAQGAFAIDASRVDLAGFSMGAFAVYRIAAQHPERWHAVLAAAGAFTDEQRAALARHLRGKTVYLVSGTADTIVPVAEMDATAHVLRNAGATVRTYRQRGAGHTLPALSPALRRAWNEMTAR